VSAIDITLLSHILPLKSYSYASFLNILFFLIFSGPNCILFYKTVRRVLENTLSDLSFMTGIDRILITISDKRDYRKRCYS
jgi:hypothetical protein